ncbi:HVO_A0556 family zinc finger protein [Halogeometricum borinquense]|uniref:HVO_A0556 family zinc finger protein n=1 Tax=Halogeometricum borinquense TaxID=60847 RepID=UPI0019550584|nr:HVO_A0556 family zinc finger protein [Halogeometricum borinquense]
MSVVDSACEELFERMEDDTCAYCEGGLVMGQYKDTAAVLCEDCGTPAIRVW